MAEQLCCRRVSGEREAARESLQSHKPRVTERHLTRVYGDRRRELEIGAMRVLATFNIRFWWKGTGLCTANEWAELLRYTEALAAGHPRLLEIAAELFPIPWRHLHHLPFPLHRLYPSELLSLLETAGFKPPN